MWKKLYPILCLILPILILFPAATPVEAQVYSTENLTLRTQNSKTWDLSNGKRSLDVSMGPVHYKDANGNWALIDNSITNGVMSGDSYTARLLQSSFNAGQIMEFSTEGESVKLQPMGLQWSNTLNQLQQISMPQNVPGYAYNNYYEMLPNTWGTEGKWIWSNAYGSGTYFQWSTTPGRLAKVITLNSMPTPPASYIINGGNPYLQFSMIFAPSAVEIYVDGTLWDKSTTKTTFNEIEFRKNGKTLWVFMPLRYWDNNGKGGQSEATLRKSGSNLYIDIKVPYTWLQKATFPVYIDTDVDKQVGASTDDASVSWGTMDYWSTTYGTLWLGSTDVGDDKYGLGARFLGVTVPNAATIDDAYVSFLAASTYSSTTVNVDIRLENVDNATTYSTSADFKTRWSTYSTGKVDWNNLSTWTRDYATFYPSPEIKTIVQTVVNRAGWVSGANMAVMVADQLGESSLYAQRQAFSYNSNAARGAKLHITYSIVSAPTVTTNDASSVEETTATTGGNVTATGGANVTERGVEYDIDTGAPYTYNVTALGNWGPGTYNTDLASLTEGELYYYRAEAKNSAGWGYGSEKTFLTKPIEPNTPTATYTVGTGNITLTWNIGAGADNTNITAKLGSYPANRADGTAIYSGAGTTVDHTGLTPGDTWYYRYWSYATEGGLSQYSDAYAQAYEEVCDLATLTTDPTTLITDVSATLNGVISDTGGFNASDRGFDWDTDSGAPYTNSWTEAGSFGIAPFDHGIAGLPPNTTIYFRAKSQNLAGWAYSAEDTFDTLLPLPGPPLNFIITQTGVTSAQITWNLGVVANTTTIRGKEDSYPTSLTDGFEIYSGPLEATNITGLNLGTTTYFYRGWSQNILGYSLTYTEAKIGGAAMMTMVATFLFVGLAVIFTIIGHLKKAWWLSTVGALLWLVVGFWWIMEGVDTLYGMTGTYTDIIYYLPFMLAVFVMADIISYWNTVEQQVVGKGYSYQMSGPKPLPRMPSSYESYKDELQRRMGTTRRRARP